MELSVERSSLLGNDDTDQDFRKLHHGMTFALDFEDFLRGGISLTLASYFHAEVYRLGWHSRVSQLSVTLPPRRDRGFYDD